jgi:LysR family glycine cleavage system transcriptional activator
MTRLPSLKFLRTFQIAAVKLSFKAAADELFITPSAVSHQIKALEEQLGITLFVRGPHSLSLSDAGRAYLQHLDGVFAKLEAVTEQLQARFGRGIVRLNIPPFFATEMLLPRLQSFLDAQPDTDIRINTTSAPLQTHSAEADLSIVVGAEPDGSHECHRLFSQTFVPACAPTFLRRSKIRAPIDLNEHTLLVHEARRDAWERWAEASRVDLHPRKLIRFDTMHAAAEAAEHGVGIALVSTRLGNDRFAEGSLVRLFGDELQTGESYLLVMRKEDSQRAELRAFTSWILREFSAAA